jgi:hypothetical protein
MAFDDRRSLGLLHVTALALVVGFSVHAMRTRPETRLIGQTKVNAGTTLSTRDGKAQRAWDMDLRLDSSVRPPGWPWILHEGKHPGEGYELHWLPEQRVLQLRREHPSVFLLGSARLAAPPERVSFQRRGGLLLAYADGKEVLRCLDPDGPLDSGALAWGCSTSGTLGEATLTVQAVTLAIPVWGSSGDLDAPVAGRTDGPFLAVAATLQHPGDPLATLRAFARARELLGATRSVPDATQEGRALAPDDRARLGLWLTLARIRWQLDSTDLGSEAAFQSVDDEIESLFTAALPIVEANGGRRATPHPELAGILMSLTEVLAQRACAIPPTALSARPEEVNARILANRGQWLDLLGRVAVNTLTIAEDRLAPDDAAQLRLLLHAVGCLQVDPGGEDDGTPVAQPLPAPLDAPKWLDTRWRAFAGGDPRSDSFPPMAGGAGPVASAIDTLAAYVDLAPVSAVSLRHQVLSSLGRRDALLSLGNEAESQRRDLEDDALRACETANIPSRERLLTRALVVLHLGSARPALLRPMHDALIASDLVRTDPVAFACDQLLRKRHRDVLALSEEAGSQALPDSSAISRYFPEYQVLMDGSAASVTRIWRVRLPHAQALAVALIMREVNGSDPDWSLLDRVPGFTLPLPLLARVRAPAASGGGAAIAPGNSGTSVAP